MSILQLKLNLPATSLNEVKEQKVRKVLQFLVTRVRTQVQDLGHRKGSSSIIGPDSFIAESSVVPQCPKGRGRPGSTESYSLACHIGLRLIRAALQWLVGDTLLGNGGKYYARLGEGQPETFTERGYTNDGGQARQGMVLWGLDAGVPHVRIGGGGEGNPSCLLRQLSEGADGRPIPTARRNTARSSSRLYGLVRQENAPPDKDFARMSCEEKAVRTITGSEGAMAWIV